MLNVLIMKKKTRTAFIVKEKQDCILICKDGTKSSINAITYAYPSVDVYAVDNRP
jgi:hypothetical protein